MANENLLYDIAKHEFLTGQTNWEEDAFKVVLVDDSYVLDAQNHESYEDIEDHIIGGSDLVQDLINTTTQGKDGVAYANNVTFPEVPQVDSRDNTNYSVAGIIIYKQVSSTDPSKNKLVAFIGNIDNLPLATNGGDIEVIWDAGTNKVFTL